MGGVRVLGLADVFGIFHDSTRTGHMKRIKHALLVVRENYAGNSTGAVS
jgi:hypothetical protein